MEKYWTPSLEEKVLPAIVELAKCQMPSEWPASQAQQQQLSKQQQTDTQTKAIEVIIPTIDFIFLLFCSIYLLNIIFVAPKRKEWDGPLASSLAVLVY